MAEFTQSSYSLLPFDPKAAAEIAAELGISAPLATALARRGITSVEAGRDFLAANAEHDPDQFPDMGAAVERIRAAIGAGARITVHGDYDADGVCATAIVIEALRSLGADCDWLIPSRLIDGYGLDDSLPAKLAERGTRLLITVDCGIASAPLIAEIEASGIEVIVTDHHAIGEQRPECPTLHPAIGYPFAGLCGAGVAAKLAEAICGEPRGLDLAALATVADSVPLVGENRRIVRQGLQRAAAAPRPGLRALMAIASVEPERISARDVAFRIAPRINAAGRLYRADAGVELLLCEQIERATEIAAELDRANHERREIESEVVAEAQRQAAEQLSDGELPALVLAGVAWHPGVVGIAASRMVDRHCVPVLMIALGDEGVGVGSGRSVAGIDLLAALGKCADLLNRFGGHKAAAGLEVDAARLNDLRERFTQAVSDQAGAGARDDREPLDGVLAVSELDLGLAQEIETLGPFGQANPEPRFLVAGAAVEDVRPMGEEGRHARLMLRSGPQRAAAVAFGAGDRAEGWAEAPVDAIVRLEVNDWNGSVSARTLVDRATPAEPIAEQACCRPAGERGAEYLGLIAASLGAIGAAAETVAPAAHAAVPGPLRPAFAALADLATSGRSLAIVTADARRRASLAARLAAITGVAPALVCARCPGPLPDPSASGLLTDWSTLGSAPGRVSADLVAIVDPAPGERIRDAALDAFGAGAELFELWGPGEAAFALACFRDEWDTRAHAASIYRGLRALPDDHEAGELAVALAGEQPICRTPAAVARALRVLADVGLVEHSRAALSGGVLEVRVVSSERTDLDRSEAYRRFCAENRAGESFLSRQQRPAA